MDDTDIDAMLEQADKDGGLPINDAAGQICQAQRDIWTKYRWTALFGLSITCTDFGVFAP